MEITKEDEEMADAIEVALIARGGAIEAHLLPLIVPRLRRVLLDRRLVKFIEAEIADRDSC